MPAPKNNKNASKPPSERRTGLGRTVLDLGPLKAKAVRAASTTYAKMKSPRKENRGGRRPGSGRKPSLVKPTPVYIKAAAADRAQWQAKADAAAKPLSAWCRDTLNKASN